jgi:glucosamine-6-phosphate deaminase
MDIEVVAPDQVGAVAAELIVAGLAGTGRPRPTLMPALGRSALGIYRDLGRLRQAGSFDTESLRLVQLDEYADLADADQRLLYQWLLRDVAAPLSIPAERIVRLGGESLSAAEACRRFDEAIAAAGGIDVAVLGLGPNGHLGFNEPPADADAPTRLVDLSSASLASNEAYWPGLPVPARALTAGMSTILAARRIVLVVTGRAKQAILRELLVGPVTPGLPASFLRRVAAATLVADEDAWPAELPRPDAPRRAERSAEVPRAAGFSDPGRSQQRR